MISTFISRGTRWLKAAAGWLLFQTGVYRRMLDGRAMIVLFHRIDDRYPDNPITSTRSDFERFIRFFTQYFDVVPLNRVLHLLANGEDLSGRISITFDDGYADNAAVAAPIIEKYGARACFFLTTECMGSNRVPPWDQEENIVSEWMTWDQVRSLRRSGYEIGAHTLTHVDLGMVLGEAARDEIEGARNRIESELAEQPTFFAYPFGRREQMAAENVTMVKQLGFACCLSAYGGAVRDGDDPFHLQRTAVTSWFVSPYQFGFELVTGRLDQQ